MKIPADAVGPITLTAKLNYRKFAHYYTQFAYAGQPKPGQAHLITPHANSAEYSFDKANIPANVSGKIKGEIPDLPIVTVATRRGQAAARRQRHADWRQVADKKDRERWNDWGIGLLLQGDLKGAEFAFKKATEAEPGYADGWLNVARALIREGEVGAAKPYVEKALAINPELPRIYFFKAMIQKAEGDYDGALASLRTRRGQVPARPRGAQPDRPASCSSSASTRRRSKVLDQVVPGRSRGRADALHRHALRPRPGRRPSARRESEALPALQGRRVRRRRSRPGAAW